MGSKFRSSRRRATTLGLVLSAALSPFSAGADEEKSPGAASPATIHQEVDLEASPDKVYDALLDAKQFGALTGSKDTQIDAMAGGAFSCFGGHILGRNVELVPKRRIVQAWRAATWPEGVYSIARFEITERASGTRIIFDHTGFPPELKEHLAAGWEEHYWRGLKTLK